VTSIRPGLPPPVQPSATPRASEADRAAAQRAFFEIAAGRAAVTRPAAPAAPASASAATAIIRDAPASAASASSGRLPRPGSLLDIKV